MVTYALLLLLLQHAIEAEFVCLKENRQRLLWLYVLRAQDGTGGERERNKSLLEIGGKTKDEKFKSEQVEGAA